MAATTTAAADAQVEPGSLSGRNQQLEGLRAVAALLVPPTHPPDDRAALALDPFDAHADRPEAWFRSSPRNVLSAGRGETLSRAGSATRSTVTVFSCSHAANAAGVTRSREQSRTAGSSPRRIAS